MECSGSTPLCVAVLLGGVASSRECSGGLYGRLVSTGRSEHRRGPPIKKGGPYETVSVAEWVASNRALLDLQVWICELFDVKPVVICGIEGMDSPEEGLQHL